MSEIEIRDSQHAWRVIKEEIRFCEELIDSINESQKFTVVINPRGLGKVTAMKIMGFVVAFEHGARALMKVHEKRVEKHDIQWYEDNDMLGSFDDLVDFVKWTAPLLAQVGMKVPK